MAPIKQRQTVGYKEDRLARTIDEADTNLPSQRQTRVHTPGQLKVRYETFGELGKGQFGEVHRALDVDAGRLLAVKIIKAPTAARGNMRELKREVEILARVSHVSTTFFAFSLPAGWCPRTDTSVSHVSSTTSRPRAGADHRWKYLWGSSKGRWNRS